MAAAGAAGYTLFHGCVNGPEQGAMGIHFVNGALVSDGALDATIGTLLREHQTPDFKRPANQAEVTQGRIR